MKAEELREMAIRFTAAGRRVFPVERQTAVHPKKPAVRGYLGSSPYSPAEVWKMPWHRAHRLGMALNPGEVGLDVDVKDDKSGREHMRLLEAAYGVLPSTLQQATPSGGEHLILRATGLDSLPGRLVLPDGGSADIDVIHNRLRYIVLYSPERILEDLDLIADLPDAWRPALTRPVSRPTRAGTAPAAAVTVADLAKRLRSTKQNRNNTLNQVVFAAMLSGFCGPCELEALRSAALETGLAPVEVDATICSAVAAGARCWSHAGTWYHTVVRASLDWTPPRCLLVLDAAACLALTTVRCGKSEVDLSCRDLAALLGVSTSTAAGALRSLLEGGWVELAAGEEHPTASYRLVLPAAANLYIHPVPAGTASTAVDAYGGVEFPVINAITQTRLRMRRLSAFQAGSTGPVLPPAALAVAAELAVGPTTSGDLRARTGLNRGTIARALRALESTSAIEMRDGVATAAAPDLVSALEDWARRMGIPDRPRARAERVAAERQGYREHRDRVEAARALDLDLDQESYAPAGSTSFAWDFLTSSNSWEGPW